MDITVLYVEGCAGYGLSRQRLLEAIDTLGLDRPAITYQVVDGPEEAQRLAFKGSPTILIDGDDPFPGGNPGSGLTCRLYDGASGPDQSPSVQQLIAVLRPQ